MDRIARLRSVVTFLFGSESGYRNALRQSNEKALVLFTVERIMVLESGARGWWEIDEVEQVKKKLDGIENLCRVPPRFPWRAYSDEFVKIEDAFGFLTQHVDGLLIALPRLVSDREARRLAFGAVRGACEELSRGL